MLKIKNISYSYENLKIFKDISFSIEKGVIGICGPSGSGKTTFLKTVGGYIEPLSGDIFFDGKNIKDDILNYRKQNGFHFQNYNLIDLDVKTNINLPFIVGKQQKNEKWINYLIKYFEIGKLLHKNINQISGGEKERVSIVKAFASKPHIIFLDEAGAALNERLKKKVFEFIKNYGKEHIVFFVSHDKNIKKYFNLDKLVYDKTFQILKESIYLHLK